MSAPKKVRAISIADPMDVIEYDSVSAAAKAIEGQVSQRNVRALITRVINKNEDLLGRKWSVDEATKPPIATSGSLLPISNVATIPIQNSKSTAESIRMAELEVQKQQILLKAKQVELLIKYIDVLKGKEDPCIVMLVKQYLS